VETSSVAAAARRVQRVKSYWISFRLPRSPGMGPARL